MRDFFQQSGKIYFDEAPCSGFKEDSMVDNHFLLHFKTVSHISTSVPDEQIFNGLKLYSVNGDFKNGAVLFFGKSPEDFFEKALIRCVSFRGTDKRFIFDDKFFGGTLFNQYRQAMEWIRGKINIAYDIEGQGGGPRKELWEIPENVFKEVVINSLSHRDYYDKGAVTTVEVFDDRVEVTNPGGLVSAIPESEFGKRSHSRNPLIFGLFARMQLVEQVGSGISRIRNLMMEAGLPEPDFHKEGMFSVLLSRPVKSSQIGSQKSSQKSKLKTHQRIFELIKTENTLTAKEISDQLNISIITAKRNLKRLQSDGLIKRIGSDKAGFWQILKQ